jgi:mono/diheme cytochrome c family protein
MGTKFWLGAAVTALVCGLGVAPRFSGAEEKQEPLPSISEIMNKGMKQGLWKRVARGEASKAESEELVTHFSALSKQKPPKGDEKSWQEKTEALVAAARAAASGQADAGAQLAAATNCGACHRLHK